jgi:ribosomal protein L11 methyltransferase
MVPVRKWAEIKIGIPREAGDVVANFLMEKGSSGIVFEDAEEREGFEIIKAYFPYPVTLDAQSISRYLAAIREFYPGICPSDTEIHLIADEDWMRRWKAVFKPSRVGRRIVVKPPWIKVTSREKIVIDIEPGMAFGTGTHPTTRLCLRALEKILTGACGPRRRGGKPVPSVLDVGMGSGILSIAAAKLGAGHITGIDVDQRAIDNASRNIRINGLMRRVRTRKVSLSRVRGEFDVVVANIDAKTIEEMRDHLMDRVGVGGALILSGLLDGEVDPVGKLFPKGSFPLAEVSVEDGWACVVLNKV